MILVDRAVASALVDPELTAGKSARACCPTGREPHDSCQWTPYQEDWERTSAIGYRLGRVVVVLGLAAAGALAALGAVTAPDWTGDLGGPVTVVRYAEPTATGHAATRWTGATDAIITVRVPEAATPAAGSG